MVNVVAMSNPLEAKSCKEDDAYEEEKQQS